MRAYWLSLAVIVFGCGASPDEATSSTEAALGDSDPVVVYASGYGRTLGAFGRDPVTGALRAKSTASSFGASPSFLAVNVAGTALYAVDEAESGRVGAYAVDRASGALRFLNAVSSHGSGPAHVAVSRSGAYVLVANYGSGTIAVVEAKEDGRLGGVVESRQVGARAHMVALDPEDRFLYVPCLGDDRIARFSFDAESGRLTPRPAIPMTSPRHIVFHPSAPYAYAISERGSSLKAFAIDRSDGNLTAIDVKSTLPDGFSGANTGAEVWVHPSGSFVYASNRGHDTIAGFAIERATGKLTPIGHTPTGGRTPRSFTIDEAGAFLYAANQRSGTIVSFAIASDGSLRRSGDAVPFQSPSFVGVVRLSRDAAESAR